MRTPQVADLSPRHRVTFAMSRDSFSTIFRVRSRSTERPTKHRYSSNVMSSRVLDNKRTIDKGRQTLASLAAIEAIRERARIDGGALVERMIMATSVRIKSLSEISNLDRQSIIYQCDVSRLYLATMAATCLAITFLN